MYIANKILAIIPARGGSKRLSNKNLKSLAGYPLIYWTISEAKKSKYIDKLIVSTENNEIAKISIKYGAEVPFMRPDELATDESGTFEVLNHAINEIKDKYDYILLLQPTSPLREVKDIDEFIEKAVDSAKSMISVCQVNHSPLWSNTLPDDLSMANFIRKEIIGKRSQDLPSYYRINGAIYIAPISKFLENRGFLGSETMAYIMDRENSIDIDTIEDFELAEFYFEKRLKNKIHNQ